MKNIRQLSRAYIQEITQQLIIENKEKNTPDFSLDKFQKKLIDCDSKYIRVIAPAGSGKTRTLLAKAIDELTNNQDAQILCLTFTNAAVNEFQKQSEKVDNYYTNRLTVSTLNSFAFTLLKETYNKLQIVTPGNRIGTAFMHIKNLMVKHKKIKKIKHDTYQTILDLADITKGLGFDHITDDKEIAEHLKFIRELGMLPLIKSKLDEIGLEDTSANSFLKTWIPFWKELIQKLWESNLITFEDQKYWCLNKLIENEKLANRLENKKYTHILIDEFQDINLLDLYLISQIALTSDASIIIVGDDDQCIYEWRGCTSKIIQHPDQFFKPIINGQKFKGIELSNNYRCPGNIVTHSSNLIEMNKERIVKEMIPVRKDDANIKVIPLPAAYITLNVVIELVASITKNHPKHTIAIVGRKKIQLIPMQILLTRENINFCIDTDLNVFDGDAFKSFRQFLELPLIYNKKRNLNVIIKSLLALLDQIGKFSLTQNAREGITSWLSSYKPDTLKDAVDTLAWYDGVFMGKYKEPRDAAKELDSFLSKTTIVNALNAASTIFKGLQKNFLKSKEDIFYLDPPYSYLADLAVEYDSDFNSFLKDIDTVYSTGEL
jgi:DNA helicase II / ATP-dependent DNA helicase PcrA